MESVNASGWSWRNTPASPISLSSSLLLGCRENAAHHGVGLRVYARRIERIVSVGLARSIVDYREAHGPFRTRTVLKKVPRLGLGVRITRKLHR
jgi:hypothetical protein